MQETITITKNSRTPNEKDQEPDSDCCDVIDCLWRLKRVSYTKNVAYFQDETVDVIPLTQNSGQIKIMPHDKLSIVVKSKDPSLSGLFNLTVTTDRLAQDNPTSGTGSSLRSYSRLRMVFPNIPSRLMET